MTMEVEFVLAACGCSNKIEQLEPMGALIAHLSTMSTSFIS